jgi:hypothetical protein
MFEHLAFSHQVMVLRRSRRRAQFSGADRYCWILLSTLWNRWPKFLMIAQPATVLHWRREGVWTGWRKGKGKRRPGRPPLDAALVSLIGQMSRSNFLWGAPRIHGELLKLGLKVSQATVAKYMVPRRRRRGPDWRVFLRNELAELWGKPAGKSERLRIPSLAPIIPGNPRTPEFCSQVLQTAFFARSLEFSKCPA